MFLESKLRLRALIFSGAVLCMFMLVVASVSIPARAQPHKQPPNLVGMTIEQARKVLEKLGFQVIEHPYSTVFPKRHHKVIAQRVGSGDKGGRSSPILQSLSPYSSQSQTVEVWFYDLNTRLRPELPAQGGSAPGAEQNKTVRVPFLIGLSQQQAFLSLVKLGLNLVVAERRETGVPALAGTICQPETQSRQRGQAQKQGGCGALCFGGRSTRNHDRTPDRARDHPAAAGQALNPTSPTGSPNPPRS